MINRLVFKTIVICFGFLLFLDNAYANKKTLRIAVADDVATMDPTFGQSGATNLFLKNTDINLQKIIKSYLNGV